MQGKEHMDYILELIRKFTAPVVNHSEVNDKQRPIIPPLEQSTMITPQEIQARLDKLKQNKSG